VRAAPEGLRVELRQLRRDVREVFVLVRRVDNHHHVVGKSIHQAIVFERAAIIQDSGVLHLPNLQRHHIVRRHVVHEVDSLGSGHKEFAHMAHVEQPAVLAHRVVLGGDPGRVLNRHFVAGKRDHLGAQRDVDVVERGALEGR
jgi:hypothetical protein